MRRRPLRELLLCALLLACGGTGACRAPDGPPPDVVVLLVGGLRADQLKPWGHPDRTPGLDTLAEKSVVFENAFAASSRTAPSLASFFTSLLPRDHGLRARGDALDPERRTLAEVFADAGYESVALSASAAFLDPATGLSRGFEIDETRDHDRETGPWECAAVTRDRSVTRGAIEVLNRERDAPLFLFAQYMGPHAPWNPHPRYRRPGTRRYDGEVDGSVEQLLAVSRGELALNDLDRAHLRSIYRAEIDQSATQASQLLDHLERLGLFEDAIVVLISENGQELSEHGGYLHGDALYREQIHVPLVIHRPGGKGEGERVGRVVSLLDVGPTLLALAGIEDPRETAGVSLLPAMEGDASGDEDAAALSELHPDAEHARLWRPRRHGAAITTARWSLLEGVEDGAYALYERTADPEQHSDVAAREPEVVKRLSARLPSGG